MKKTTNNSKLTPEEWGMIFKTIDEKRVYLESRRPEIASQYADIIIKLYELSQ
jgi:hypothetical protein